MISICSVVYFKTKPNGDVFSLLGRVALSHTSVVVEQEFFYFHQDFRGRGTRQNHCQLGMVDTEISRQRRKTDKDIIGEPVDRNGLSSLWLEEYAPGTCVL